MYHNPLEYSTQYNTMKITNVKYGRTYSLGNFCSERIDLEASVDTDTEDIYECLEKLKDTCNTYHKANNPQLCTEKSLFPLDVWDWEDNKWEENPPSTPKTQPHSTIEAINSCKNLKELQDFQLLVKNMSNKYPEIQEAYDNKLKQLQP